MTFKRTIHILKVARDKTESGFKELSEEQDTLAAKNSKCDVDGSEILNINAGGTIIYVTRGTLTQIKGTRPKALLCGRWEKRLLRDRYGRIFLDVDPACFRVLVYYLNKRHIIPPDSTMGNPHVSEEYSIVLWQLLLAFGLEGDRLVHSKKTVMKLKVRKFKDRSDVNSVISQDN